LKNPLAYQLIRYKRNYLKDNLWESLLLVGSSSFSSINPFLDALFSQLFVNGKRVHWFEIFGIQEFLNLKNSNRLHSLNRRASVLERLEDRLVEIEKERDFFDLNKFKSIFSPNQSLDACIQRLINLYIDDTATSDALRMLTAAGAGLANSSVIPFSKNGKTLLLTITALCAVFIYITYKSLAKMIDLCEIFAYDIYNIVHNS
jgi:hypothetical protein